MAVAQIRLKPRLRGVFHEFGFYAAIGLAVPLTLTAEPGRARLAAIVFAACVAACFGARPLYHRPFWRPRVRARLARVDHAGVYLLIAGTYTPFGLLVLSTGWVVPFSQLLKLPVGGLVLVVIGGLAYTAGAVTYALRRPDPFPTVLGYHEIFHVLTLVAVGCQYAAIAFYV